MKIFVLEHEYEFGKKDEVKNIGYFHTREEAELVAEGFKSKPGFCNWPDGFVVSEVLIGHQEWSDGFIALADILVPAIDMPDTLYPAEAKYLSGDSYEILGFYIAEQERMAAFNVGDVVKCFEEEVESMPRPKVLVGRLG